jgi:hypothetical protein
MEAELELWGEEMALLRPYFLKKRAGDPQKRKEILVKADLEKAAGKVVPRFRAEQRASDLEPEAAETLEALEEKAEDVKTALTDDANATDELSAALQTAEGIRKLVKSVGEELSANRYRALPDPEY